MNEEVYMALQVIKQGGDEKVKVYYEHILKLANCLQHQEDDSLLTIFFRIGLQPDLWITTMGMKRDTLFKHKEVAITYEENMGDANEYQKLLEPPTKQKKANEGKKTYVIYNQCNKPKHFDEGCHQNPNNLVVQEINLITKQVTKK
jgi:hypothetical protein